MRFASIVEDLGTSFFSSLITLIVFLPILWGLSASTSPSCRSSAASPGSLVWVALVSAAFGTVLLAVVGVRLPGPAVPEPARRSGATQGAGLRRG